MAEKTKNGNNTKTQSIKKTLLDYIYTLGNKQAIECVEVTKYLLNHIQEKYQFGDDIVLALEEREAFNIKIHKPVKEIVDPAITRDAKANLEEQNNLIYQAQIKKYVDREVAYSQNVKKAYSLLFKQCAKTLKEMIKRQADFKTRIKGNGIKLLKTFEALCMNYKTTK